jgi:hypothetical protein
MRVGTGVAAEPPAPAGRERYRTTYKEKTRRRKGMSSSNDNQTQRKKQTDKQSETRHRKPEESSYYSTTRYTHPSSAHLHELSRKMYLFAISTDCGHRSGSRIIELMLIREAWLPS